MISPHFPPDSTAGAHRVRVIAPHLSQFGWQPTVLAVDPQPADGALDEELAASVPADLDVVRCRAWSSAWTRAVGVGDLGLRTLGPMWRQARSLMRDRRIDAVYVTTYPIYPAILGPWLKREYRVPFVLDLQDPWVGAWGLTVGAGPGGAPEMRSRISRSIAARLERYVMPRADALTGVSSTLLDELAARYPVLKAKARVTLPIGNDPADAAWARAHETRAPWMPVRDGALNLCYTGTLLPLGVDTVRALLQAVRRIRDESPSLASRLRLHFVGTSNQAREGGAARVLPIAAGAGVADLVREHPARVPYMDALRAQMQSSAVLLLGTTEARYTASKLHTALASGRPLLAVFHEASDVARALAPIVSRPGDSIITYDDRVPVLQRVDDIRSVLHAWLQSAPPDPRPQDPGTAPPCARELARRLAGVFDGLESATHAHRCRVTVVLTHPVQYFTPWFRHIERRRPELRLHVLYAVRPTPVAQGVGFARAFEWDEDLLNGLRQQGAVGRAVRIAPAGRQVLGR